MQTDVIEELAPALPAPKTRRLMKASPPPPLAEDAPVARGRPRGPERAAAQE